MVRTSLLKFLFVWSIWLMVGQFAFAHDPSAWGGVFRTRDFGGSWLAADAGLFIGGALALSVSPRDPNHLLYATDTRLLRSRNGGRDWIHEAADKLMGPTTSVCFDQEGRGAVASSSAGVFWTEDGKSWSASAVGSGASPARSIVTGRSLGTYYLAGPKGVFVSRDHGKSFARAGETTLPDAAATALMVVPQNRDRVFAILAGELWSSVDDGATWQSRSIGLPAGQVEAISADGGEAQSLWAAAGGRVYTSQDSGSSWTAFGNPLPDSNTSIRGIAVARGEKEIILATHRGALRSSDAGMIWAQIEGTLPVHLEAGLLLRDPHDSQTLYAGFALTPYPEIYRRAELGSNLLSQLDPVSVAGGIAFLLLLLIGGWWVARRLSRTRITTS